MSVSVNHVISNMCVCVCACMYMYGTAPQCMQMAIEVPKVGVVKPRLWLSGTGEDEHQLEVPECFIVQESPKI